MTTETALVAGLTGYSGLAALVSTRIYPNRRPQEAVFPCITYQRISTAYDLTMGNTIVGATVRWQFDTWARDPNDGDAIQPQLVAALRALPNSGGSVFHDRIPDNERDEFDPVSLLYRRRFDWLIQNEGA